MKASPTDKYVQGHSWANGRIVETAAMGHKAIAVVVEIDRPNQKPERRDMFMLAASNSPSELLDYANDLKDETSRLCIEDAPSGERGAISGGLPILAVVLPRDVDKRDIAAFA